MNNTNLAGKGKSIESKISVETLNEKTCVNRDNIKLKTEVEETVDNIAEMIANGDCDPRLIGNPRTKKQILLSRNAEADKQFPKHAHFIESSGIRASGQSAINGRSSEGTLKHSDEKYADRRSFEEIEDKLEEMFAGIDDENLNSTIVEKISNENLINTIKKVNSVNNMDILSSNSYIQGVSATNKLLLPTKAAMKSTVCFSNNAPTENKDCEKNSKPFQHLRTMPIRRRLSIEIDSEFLKFPEKNNEKINDEIQNIVEDHVIKRNCSTSKKLRLQKTRAIKLDKGDTNKIKKNNGKEYKVNKRNNKQNLRKNYTTNTTKIKQGRLQRYSPSDNEDELEEKNQQPRDMDNKNRSPFILVNTNGNITIVNTFMQDESNEKFNKTKIQKTYVFERKTVKGCHSSTLSNRYDADTADSSWICVFCKKGPHKKGLGDLFGPYIISNDCDEYKSNKDRTEFLTEISSQGLTLYNKKAKYLNDNSIKSHTCYILDTPKRTENRPSPNYSLGMIKTSECSYEIWIHEDCAIWAPKIYITGSRLTGLEEAVWNSVGHECCYCLKPGALLCCLQRDCKIMAHVPCAREVNWLIDETSFLTLCKNHFQAK